MGVTFKGRVGLISGYSRMFLPGIDDKKPFSYNLEAIGFDSQAELTKKISDKLALNIIDAQYRITYGILEEGKKYTSHLHAKAAMFDTGNVAFLKNLVVLTDDRNPWNEGIS